MRTTIGRPSAAHKPDAGTSNGGHRPAPGTHLQANLPPWVKPPDDLLALQRLADRGSGEIGVRPSGAPGIQAKLKVGQPNDGYEQEADRIADAVVSMPDATPTAGATLSENEWGSDPVQPCPECKERAPVEVRAKSADGSAPAGVSDTGQSEINGLEGRGQALSDGVRSYFEPRFGRDFGAVRLHTDSGAAQLAESLNARAFTVGHDIVFGAGQYTPQTVEGKRLIAHELAHTLQQGSEGNVIRRKLLITNPTYSYENPIGTALRGAPLGLTTPTFNGAALPPDPAKAATPAAAKALYGQAGQTVMSALTPKAVKYNASTKEGAFEDYNVSVSSNVLLATPPSTSGWTMNFPRANLPPELSACRGKGDVPVVMTGKPDSASISKQIAANEQEHVDDLKTVSNAVLAPAHAEILSLRAKGDDIGKCQEDLMKQLGAKDALAAQKFLKDWDASINQRHQAGGHIIQNRIAPTANCASIDIESNKK